MFYDKSDNYYQNKKRRTFQKETQQEKKNVIP